MPITHIRRHCLANEKNSPRSLIQGLLHQLFMCLLVECSWLSEDRREITLLRPQLPLVASLWLCS